MQRNATVVGLSAILWAAGAPADWNTINLNHLGHGKVVDDVAIGPLKAKAVNFHHPESRLVAFDTRKRDTRDPDLEGPNGEADQPGQPWSAGNIDRDNVVGTVLILQETGETFAGYRNTDPLVVNQPDDLERHQSGKRPGAGEITFQFDRMVSAFRFTLFDIEPTQAFEEQTASFVVFSGGDMNVKISFADLIDPDSDYYDPTIKFGDHSANRFPPITADQLGLIGIERVVINLGGSGGVGQLSYFEDEPDIGIANFFTEDTIGSGDLAVSGYGADQPGGGGTPGGGGGPGPDPDPEDPDDPIEPKGIPSPGAAVAGVMIMSLLVGRRPRRRNGPRPHHDHQSTS